MSSIMRWRNALPDGGDGLTVMGCSSQAEG
jgi:hypothetical protein